MKFYTFDLETFPNIFLFSGKFLDDSRVYTFEISDRVNQRNELLSHLSFVQNSRAYMVGFNSIGFDYHILHDLLTNPYTFDALHAHVLGTKIIQSQGFGSGRQGHYIKMTERIIPQIDLYKINHFDNVNKATSLKALQFAMRSESVEDLPFSLRPLTFPEMDELVKYNVHDVLETEKFLRKNLGFIKMRQDLLEEGVLSGDVLNYSDVKIGTEYLIRKIGREKCFIKGSQPRQTVRSSVALKDVILPKIKFRTETFDVVRKWFNEITLYMGDDRKKPKLEIELGGIPFVFGLGGVHASVDRKYFESDDEYVIKDVDVAGMYPAVANVNGFAPEHLGKDFVNAYRQLSADRKQYAKGTSRNLVLKLANNGASGNFENQYSPLFDAKCAYSVRINGQLQLLQLGEVLSLIPRVKLIQANTDGVTALVPRALEDFFNLWCNDWEAQTGYKLEHTPYKRMWIRDVNSYIAEGIDGTLKRKGAYWYPLKDEDYQGSSGSNWNKDFSNLSAQKGIEACLVYGIEPQHVVRLISDPFDFMLRYKTPAGAKLYVGDREQLKTVRYYVSTKGEPMKKIATPKGEIGAFKKKNGISDAEYKKFPSNVWNPAVHTKNKSQYAAVTTSVQSGRRVRVCNRAKDFNWADVDWEYYVAEIEKLRIGAPNV